MKPVTLLPDNYVLRASLDLSKDKKLLVGLSVASFVLFFVFGLLFLFATAILVPDLPTSGSLVLSLPEVLGVVVIMFVVMVLVIVLHEAVHGVFFWLFTGERPVFGFKGIYAYAAAPKWYIPRMRYIIVGLAPFVLLTLLGLMLLRVSPLSIAPMIIFALTINAAGAVGDFYIVFRLLLAPSTCLAHDMGDGIAWYVPDQTS